MPNTTLQEAIKEAFVCAPADKVILDTLEIRQPSVQPPILLVRSRTELAAYDENGVPRLFRPSSFGFTLPAANEEGYRSLSLTIDNVGHEATQFIYTALSAPVAVEVVYRPYLSTDLSAPQMIPPITLFLKDLEVNAVQITAKATFMDVVNQKFPSELYTTLRFPGFSGLS